MYEAASEEALSVELSYVRRWYELGPCMISSDDQQWCGRTAFA